MSVIVSQAIDTPMLLRYRSLSLYALLFSVFFVLHIFFAANNLDLFFQLVAIIITIMSVFCGAVCVIFEPKKENYKPVFQLGIIMSVPICVGLGWAHNNMSTGIELIIFPLVSLLIHNMIRLSPMGDTYGLK